MAKMLDIRLTEADKHELEKARDTHPKAYIRERSAAILKIAAGESGHQVALHGLHKKRKADTVYEWVHHYEEDGLAGLFMKEGRGRKAAFFPSGQERA